MSTQRELKAALAIHYPALRRRAFALTRSEALADDVLHDSIERAIRFCHQLDSIDHAKAWLERIVYSVFITHCRKKKRERNLLERERNEQEELSPPPTLRELPKYLATKLAELPEPYRVAVERVDLHDASYLEASRELAVPVGTIMSRLSRGRRLLREAVTGTP